MKQSSFKVKKKTWENQSQENNSLYQIEVYSQEYKSVVNLTTIIKSSSKTLRLL